MRALQYFFSEAVASLWRARSAAVLAIVTIAVGLFVLGFFLVLNTNLQRVVSQWSESAELSVYLNDDATAEQLKSVDEMVAGSGLSSRRHYLSKAAALARFKGDFPDLASTAGALSGNPFPASFEVQLRTDVRGATGAVDGFVTAMSGMPGVADVHYDREWLTRLNAVVRGMRIAGGVIVVMLALAAAMTVANVVRLAAASRRDEIEIMQLVGAPFAYVRGPFVAEGILQGGAGALLALLALAAGFYALRLRFGAAAVQATGGDSLTFLPVPVVAILLLGGMTLGCIGGYVVARRVR
ncbi:MAG: ABC transporter permease [Acidobacteria bacterium]|nr:ABC transporter permease [Acidobacteriota bacterium]